MELLLLLDGIDQAAIDQGSWLLSQEAQLKATGPSKVGRAYGSQAQKKGLVRGNAKENREASRPSPRPTWIFGDGWRRSPFQGVSSQKERGRKGPAGPRNQLTCACLPRPFQGFQPELGLHNVKAVPCHSASGQCGACNLCHLHALQHSVSRSCKVWSGLRTCR